MKVKVLSVFLIVVFFSIGLSQNRIPVRKVEFSGIYSAESELMKFTSGLIPGKKISSDDIQSAIKNLWNLRIFSDIEIYKTNPEKDFIDILIKVEEYPTLEELKISGAKKIKKEEINNELGFYTGIPIYKQKIEKELQELKKLFEKKGFLLADLKYDIKKSENKGKVIVELNINEGEEIRIKEILFYGNNEFDDGTLKGQFEKTKENKWWRKGDFKREEFEKDKEKVLEFYRNYGYKNAKIVKDSLSYSEDKKNLFIHIYIDEGDKYYFGDITFEGDQSLPEAELKKKLTFERGDVYSEEKLNNSIEAIRSAYYNKGYLYAQPMQQEFVEDDTLNFRFAINEGNQIKINKIFITGNTTTKDFVIRRELRIKPGSIFSSDKIEGSVRDLMILNYFYNVNPTFTNMTENTIDLVFEVEEKPTGTANMSAGYSQLDGMIGSLGVGMNNLFGNGQKFNLNWQFGKIYRSFQIGFTEPWFGGKPTLAGINFFDLRRGGRYFPYDYKSRGISLNLGRRFTFPDRYFRGDLIFSASKNKYWNFKEGFNYNSPFFLGQNSTHYSITLAISRDSRDRPEFPTKGSVVILRNQFAGGMLGGSEDFNKHEFITEFYFNTFWKFVLYQNFKVGIIKQHYSDSYVPPLERFYMGGSALSIGEPLRGYEERSVGPTLGGFAMLKYSTEFRFPISPKPTIFGLVFAEAGNIWNELKYSNPFDMKKSIGFGFRMYMPMMGIIGIDIGYGFDHFENGVRKPQFKTHFQFGRSF